MSGTHKKWSDSSNHNAYLGLIAFPIDLLTSKGD